MIDLEIEHLNFFNTIFDNIMDQLLPRIPNTRLIIRFHSLGGFIYVNIRVKGLVWDVWSTHIQGNTHKINLIWSHQHCQRRGKSQRESGICCTLAGLETHLEITESKVAMEHRGYPPFTVGLSVGGIPKWMIFIPEYIRFLNDQSGYAHDYGNLHLCVLIETSIEDFRLPWLPGTSVGHCCCLALQGAVSFLKAGVLGQL